MQFNPKRVVCALILCGLASYSTFAQEERKSEGSVGTSQVHSNDISDHHIPVTLTADDGLAIIAAALDSHVRVGVKRDCSHLVHAIYLRAGFPYAYVRSSDLYKGIDEFQRVADPQPGDLVVWRGHVGIIVNPAQHIFFSVMRSGPGIDAYDAPYWKRRGQVRFFRYIEVNGKSNSHAPLVLTHQHE